MSDVAAPPAPPKRSHHAPLAQVKNLSDAFEHPDFIARIKQAAPKHMSPDRMLSTFILAVRKTPKLLKVDMMSFLGACIGLASVGLEPNTPLGQAYLIPFDESKWNPRTRQREVLRTNVQVIFGYQGLLDLSYRSGMTRSIHADVVWQGDEFDFHYGTGGQLKHRPLGKDQPEDAMPIWAYMHAAMKGEAENFEVMPISAVLKVRNGTQAYRAAEAARQQAAEKGWKVPASYTEAPWVRHFVPMARKTVFRAGSKWLPKSIELAAALAWDELQDRRNPDYGAIIEGSADVLDGGLSALEQSTELPDMDLGQSWDEPEPLGSYQSANRDDRPAQQHQVKLPKWAGFVVDEHGETVGEAISDPVAFAEALRDVWKGSNSRRAVMDANRGYAEQAASNSVEAASLIRELWNVTAAGNAARGAPAGPEPAPAAANPPSPLGAVEVPKNRRGADWPAYVKSIRDALRLVRQHEISTWVDANLPTIMDIPDVHRLMVVKIIGEHCAAIGSEPPQVVQLAIQGFDGRQRLRQDLDDALTDIGDAPSLPALEGWIARPAFTQLMQRLQAEDVALAVQLDQGVRQRRAELTDPPLDPEDDFPGR